MLCSFVWGLIKNREINWAEYPVPSPAHVFTAGGRVLLHLGKSSIDGLVFCFVIIPCQLVFVWLFLVSVLTYRAASGALAVLSSSEKVCNQIIKVLLSNILYPSYKRFSTAKRAREFSTPLDYYAWHRASRGHETRGSGDENGFYAAYGGAQNSELWRLRGLYFAYSIKRTSVSK